MITTLMVSIAMIEFSKELIIQELKLIKQEVKHIKQTVHTKQEVKHTKHSVYTKQELKLIKQDAMHTKQEVKHTIEDAMLIVQVLVILIKWVNFIFVRNAVIAHTDVDSIVSVLVTPYSIW